MFVYDGKGKRMSKMFEVAFFEGLICNSNIFLLCKGGRRLTMKLECMYNG